MYKARKPFVLTQKYRYSTYVPFQIHSTMFVPSQKEAICLGRRMQTLSDLESFVRCNKCQQFNALFTNDLCTELTRRFRPY
jgi:hypothetical protein